MGGKSNQTKYVTELPILFACIAKSEIGSDFNQRPPDNYLDLTKLVNPEKSIVDIRKAIPIACEMGTREFVANFNIAKEYLDKINSYCVKNNYPLPSVFDWQADDNNNDNDSPADVLFVGHPLGGVSVKAGAPNLFNLGTKDLNLGNAHGSDLFEHLAPVEFATLMKAVKKCVVNSIPSVGDVWTDPTRKEHDLGKYAIERVSEDEIELRYGKGSVRTTESNLFHNIFMTQKGMIKKIAKRANRVFGDFYQQHKDQFVQERDNLYAVIKPKLIDVFVDTVTTDKKKLSQLGGFTERAYFYVDFGKKSVYYVPSINDVKENIQVDIANKDGTFGAGLDLLCEIKTKPESSPTTVEWHIRYHTGTFAGPPQNMIQGLKNKENIWQTI
jgi:hypothetical protein